MNYQLSIKHTLLLLTLMATTVGAWAQTPEWEAGEPTQEEPVGTTVAKIGDTGYSSLTEAVAAAKAWTEAAAEAEKATPVTITLTSDLALTYNAVVVTTPIVLDLARYTITSHEKEPIVIFNGGDLTITGNGTITGPTGEEGATCDGWSVICVNGADSYEGAKAKLTYLNGTLTSGGVGSDGMYGVYVLNGGTATFGEVTAEGTATGPTIESWFAAIGENNTTAPAHITVNGGSYKALANPQNGDNKYWWYYFCAPIYASAAGTIEIHGGEFEGYYAISTPYNEVDLDFTVTDGTFTGTNPDKQTFLVEERAGASSGDGKTRDITVSGGTFSAPVPEALCAKDFQPEADADGKYTVIEAIAVSDLTTARLWSEYAAKGKPLNITYTRTSGMVSSATNTGTKYGTLCLPFTITAKPDGMTLYKATNLTATTLTITEVTTDEAPIPAGTPLIFELNSAATSLTLTSKKATPVSIGTAAEPATPTTPADGNLLRGTYTAQELTTDLTTKYYLNGDKFHQAIKKLKVPAFRAYIEVPAASPAAPREILTMVRAGEAEATSLTQHNAAEPTIVEVHDILGHPQPGLQRGINLVRYSDGRTMKVIVK